MSTGRDANTVLFTLIVAIILFAALLGVSGINLLERHAYALEYGWQTPTPNPTLRVCDRPLINKGFPFTNSRPAADIPNGCQYSTNPLAEGMNIALCFAIASIISATCVNAVRNRY